MAQADLPGVLLVAPRFSSRRYQNPELQESIELIRGAGARLLEVIPAPRNRPDGRGLIGAGKIAEVGEAIARHQPEVVIFDQPLTPAQESYLQQQWCLPVVDRVGLILDVFSRRAKSYEGKLQVEMAQLRRLWTRLVRGWTHLERQKGGIGLRGPGETQLETDRRLLRDRMAHLERRLLRLQTRRGLARRARRRANSFTVALVGYTNSGKSTLFNRLTGSDVLAADRFFATLDPTLRRMRQGGGQRIVLADTVGFVRQLPVDLVAAFKATLEEVVQADLLLVVDDVSGNDELTLPSVLATLEEIGVADKPRIIVHNKIDLAGLPAWQRNGQDGEPLAVGLSAMTGEGVPELVDAIQRSLGGGQVRLALTFPGCQGDLRARFHEQCTVLSEDFAPDGGWHLRLELPSARRPWLERLVAARAKVEVVT